MADRAAAFRQTPVPSSQLCARAHNSFTENRIILVTFFHGLTPQETPFFAFNTVPGFCRHVDTHKTTSDGPPARQWCAERILRSRHSTNDVPELIPKSVVIRTSHNITARSAQLSVWWRQPCNCQESGLPESFWMSPGNRMIS